MGWQQQQQQQHCRRDSRGALAASSAFPDAVAHRKEERETKRSLDSEEEVDMRELVEYGFDEKSGVRPMRVQIEDLGGVDGYRDHNERVPSDCEFRRDNGQYIVKLEANTATSSRRIRAPCAGMTGTTVRGESEGEDDRGTRRSRLIRVGMPDAWSKTQQTQRTIYGRRHGVMLDSGRHQAEVSMNDAKEAGAIEHIRKVAPCKRQKREVPWSNITRIPRTMLTCS